MDYLLNWTRDTVTTRGVKGRLENVPQVKGLKAMTIQSEWTTSCKGHTLAFLYPNSGCLSIFSLGRPQFPNETATVHKDMCPFLLEPVNETHTPP